MLTVESSVTGVQVNYYFICKTKLWYFSHYTTMEHTSDTVLLGKLIHNESYQKTQGLSIDRIAIDFIERGDKIILHEVKKSRSMEKAHIFQVLYYLYDLNQRGIKATGIINYPVIRKKQTVDLKPDNLKELEAVLGDIQDIVNLKSPPQPERKKYCKKCSYYELCWVV
jgi:CRISPR-associated exonuclease Cas4